MDTKGIYKTIACIVSSNRTVQSKKKNVVYMFSQKNEKERKRKVVNVRGLHEERDIILVSVTQACSVLL